MSLIRRPPRVSQPQGSAEVDRANSLYGLWSAGRATDKGTLPFSGPTALGLAYRTTNANAERATITGGAWVPASGGFTMLLSMRYGAALGTGQGAGIIGLGGSLSIRATAYLGETGVVHFDYGGATDGVTRVSAAVATADAGVARYVFSTGPRGMEIWRNGRLIASNSANPTRTVGSENFGVGDCYGGTSGNADYPLISAWTQQLSAEHCRAYSQNPWQLFAPEPRRLSLSTAAAAPDTVITGTVGAASATGVQGLFNTTIACSVGAASAVGVTSLRNTTVQASVGAAAAVGVTARLNTTLQANVAAAAAVGVTAQLAASVSAGPGNAAAPGVNAVIATAGTVTIVCSVGAAAAAGVTALINTTLQAAVGAAGAQGVTARMNVTLQTGVGAASAIGVSFTSGGLVYIPSLLQFSSPARSQAFTSPARAQAFTSPTRTQAFTSPARNGS